VPSLRRTLVVSALAYIGVNYWLRTHPSPFPHAMRRLLDLPRPAHSREHLLDVLEPRDGERIVELGPGSGYYSFAVAAATGSGGLDVLDAQQEFLDDVAGEAARRGVSNIRATLGDARSLPYADDSFDAGFLVNVLGEVPDQAACLSELARVLRPQGRLLVGESVLAGDPHMVPFGSLRRRAEESGFVLERRSGGPLAYFARFSAPRSTRASAS
jgi:SAM-dependent methyltransferase